MTRTITRGDPSLARYWETKRDPAHYESLFTTMGFVWDTYGLADGQLNPTSRFSPTAPRDGSHVTMVPRPAEIDKAMNSLLRTILDDDDQWMLTIPRVLVPGKASTEILVSHTGGAVLLMPMAAFGTLFRWNEQTTRGGLRNAEGHPPSNPRNPGLVRMNSYLFTGNRTGVDQLALMGLMMGLDSWAMTQAGAANRQRIWKYTIFQQAMMILHEFGHIKLINGGLEAGRTAVSTSGAGLLGEKFQNGWDRFTDEMMADAQMSVWLGRLADSLHGRAGQASRLVASNALWQYFMLLDIVNETNGRPVEPWVLSIRFLYLLQDLGMVEQYEKFHEVLEMTAGIVGGRTRRHFIVHQYMCYIDHAMELAQSRGRASQTEVRNLVPVLDCFHAARAALGLLM